MSNVIALKSIESQMTTAPDQYHKLEVSSELKLVREALKAHGMDRKLTKPFMLPIMYGYDMDYVAYKKLLNAFKRTGITEGVYRTCGMRGIIEILIPNGRYVINLTANGEL